MKRLLATLLLVSGAFGLNAQEFPSQKWHKGEIRLNDNTYQRGDIKYDLDHEAVQLEQHGKVFTYSAQKVASFKIFDADNKGFRHFFTLPYSNKVGRKTPKFFEVIVEGKATLLAREFVATIGVNNSNRLGNRRLNNGLRNNGLGNNRFGNPSVSTRQVLAHKMYIVNLSGTIQELTKRRRDLYFILKGHDDDLKKFIKKENLKLERVADMARVVGHYNSISVEQTKAH